MFLTKSLSIIYDLFDKYIGERTKYLRKEKKVSGVMNELLGQMDAGLCLMSEDQMSRLLMMNGFLLQI